MLTLATAGCRHGTRTLLVWYFLLQANRFFIQKHTFIYELSVERLLVTYQTTVGWSLVSSGLVTLVLKVLPYDSLWWGIALLIVGIIVFAVQQT